MPAGTAARTAGPPRGPALSTGRDARPVHLPPAGPDGLAASPSQPLMGVTWKPHCHVTVRGTGLGRKTARVRNTAHRHERRWVC